MRLIGGNISDTPVKEIGDGSAFQVGGGGDWQDTRLTAVNAVGDAHWDNVRYLFQPHLADTLQTKGVGTTGSQSFSLDRKDPSIKWETFRQSGQASANPGNYHYAEFTEVDDCPLGVAWACNRYGYLGADDTPTDIDPNQDWTLEFVKSFRLADTKAESQPVNGDFTIYTSSSTYKWAMYAFGGGGQASKSGGSIYSPAANRTMLARAAPDAHGDYTEAYNPQATNGLFHFMIHFDVSSGKVGFFHNGIMIGPAQTGLDYSGYVEADAVKTALFFYHNVSNLGGATGCAVNLAGFRMTLGADRYGIGAGSWPIGRPTTHDNTAPFKPDIIFPENGT